jgi:hypothetical protein
LSQLVLAIPKISAFNSTLRPEPVEGRSASLGQGVESKRMEALYKILRKSNAEQSIPKLGRPMLAH